MKKNIKTISILSIILITLSSGRLMAQTVGNPAPDFSLQTLKGSTFNLADQKGKVVFIFLFGNTCPHCIANGPNTQSVYDTYMSNPDFVAIGVDVWNGNSSAVSSFKNRTGINYDLALDGAELTSKYSSTYDRILVVDQEGILRYKASSNATADITAQVSDLIGTLLMDGSTGIGKTEYGHQDLNIFPNPLRDKGTLQISFQAGTEFKIEIIDITGRIIFSEDKQANLSGKLELQISDIPSGMYYLITRSKEETFGTRIIVAK